MPLTDAAIRCARPKEKSYKLVDGGGLTLLINPNGSKWWRLRYRFGGREKMLSVGVYPDLPLKNARDKRENIRKLIASGADPSAKREAEKVAQAETFAAIAGEWLDLQRKGFSATPLGGASSGGSAWEATTPGKRQRRAENSYSHRFP